jgi:hypothetical protein
MKAVRERLTCLGLVLIVVAVLTPGGCPVSSDEFVSISDHGFDPVDYEQDLNDYPWSMRYFAPAGAATGQLYVGTGNNIAEVALAFIAQNAAPESDYRPPEIRRYRPKLGARVWERVLDYREVEAGPEWETTGFRSMGVYHAPAEGLTYLYAGTIGDEPALWRSPTGDPGSWERVWTSPTGGSIRALTEHDGRLYFGMSHESVRPQLPAEVYATDGATVWAVCSDGFGNSENKGVFALASFNGWLYAGTINPGQGFEVWKLEGPAEHAERVQVVAGGGPSRSNQAVTQMVVFQDRLYVPSLIYFGINLNGGFPIRGADMVRIDEHDNVETVVGPQSTGGVRSGFGRRTNPYLWSITEHAGRLYCGTWDSASVVPVGMACLAELILPCDLDFANRPGGYDLLTGDGGDLYVSADGVQWDPVFTNGLGNPDNYGVRTMVSAEGTLFLGMANVLEGLEIWQSRTTGSDSSTTSLPSD